VAQTAEQRTNTEHQKSGEEDLASPRRSAVRPAITSSEPNDAVARDIQPGWHGVVGERALESGERHVHDREVERTMKAEPVTKKMLDVAIVRFSEAANGWLVSS